MKTFDIAVNYLKDIDLKEFPIVINGIKDEGLNESMKNAVQVAMEKFNADENNNKSNDYYQAICFGTALIHLIFKAHGWTSFFDVACEIIEAHQDIINTKFERYLGTSYPKIMLDEWIKYCDELKTKTNILEGELRDEFFFTAYHYIIEPDRA